MRHKGYEERVQLVKKLSQEEGLNDRQISERIGCSRVTVSRIRIKHKIKVCNKANRKDKVYYCANCKAAVYIRRRDRRQLLCDKCKEVYTKEHSF